MTAVQPDGPARKLPLVDAYLGDLERALGGLEESERADVVAAVSEHIEAYLAQSDGSAADVAAVLEHLGPVERIAREAWDATPAVLVVPSATATDRTTWPTWSASGFVVLAAVALSLIVVDPYLALPIALATGAVSTVGARRQPRPVGVYWAAVALSGLAVIIAIGAAMSLFGVQTGVLTPDPIVSFTPGAP